MKKRKFISLIGIVLATTMLFSACAPNVEPPVEPAVEETAAAETPAAETPAAETAAAPAAADLKIGVVLTTTGKGDKSFNDSAVVGLEKAVTDFGIEYKDIQPKDVADIEKSIDFLAKDGYDIIFSIGFTAADAVNNVAAKYPETDFVIIDYDYGTEILPNVKSVVFKEEEGSYLAGVLAANQTTTNTIGFVGGMESPLIEKFEAGFTAGAKSVNPDINVLVNYVSPDASGFSNPAKGKEIALDMISKDADIIYQAAGGSGVGVLEACAEKGKLAIGVDSNQNWLKPGTVIASMLKRVDVAVYTIIDEKIKGTLTMGDTVVYDLEAGGVGLTDLDTLTPEETDGVSPEDQAKIQAVKDTITDETKAQIEAAESGIIDGSIVVPSTVE